MESNHVTESTTSEDSVNRPAKMGHTAMNFSSAKDRWGKLKTTVSVTNQIAPKKPRRLDRGDSFLRKFSTRNQAENDLSLESEDTPSSFKHSRHKTLKSFVVHPSGGLMFYWLGLVTLSVLYNLWTCIAREAFREIQKGYMVVWFCLDAACDCVYLCDIFVQFRTGYLQQGLMVYDSSKLCRNYLKDKCFIVDLLALLPLDFIQFYTGVHPMLRFPRFLKIYRSVRFMHMYESRTAYPNLLRVASLSHILFLGSHWFAAFYYLISEAEGFAGDWSYPKPIGHYAAVTRKYLACLYWSTLTLTTIGDLPPPDTNWQYVFVIVSYLIGVFIFATIVGVPEPVKLIFDTSNDTAIFRIGLHVINAFTCRPDYKVPSTCFAGQVGNVITNRNASRQEFERLLDGAKFYMQMHNVPPDLQKRVQRWYDYVWTRGRLNCNDINSLGLLPDKLKTELALHVNLGTLKKVTIFQKCRPEFLHDLMLKMRAYIFTPGDLICRRGEVAREMFIIADGVVEILGENGTVLTQMSTGDFFGEIGILNLDGGINRRTADVRSVGYSELFVLSREDVLAALKDHPDAEEILTTYARMRLENLLSLRTLTDTNEESSNSSKSIIVQFSNEAFSDSENSSSESEKEVVHDKPKDTPFLPVRDRISRKSSPSILPIPTTLKNGTNRKYSCAPPLDLPIEVPSFSNFRGLSGNTKELSFSLERFKTQIMERLDNMETSNRDTQIRLQETLLFQEKMMKNIMKKLASKEKTKDDVTSGAPETVIDGDLNRNMPNAINTPGCKVSESVINPIQSKDNVDIAASESETTYQKSDKELTNSTSAVLANVCTGPSCSTTLSIPPQSVRKETSAIDKENGRQTISVKDKDSAACDGFNEGSKTIELFEDESVYKANKATEHLEYVDYKVTHL